MSKRVRLIIFESFVPFFFLIVALFFILYRVDLLIEGQSNELVIDLNETTSVEEDETETILQQVNIQNLSPAEEKLVKSINQALDAEDYVSSLSLISHLPENLKNHDETILTQAYCLYKLNKYKQSLKVLKNINNKKSLRYYYNKALVYGKYRYTLEKALKNYFAFIKEKPQSYAGNMQISMIYFEQKKYKEAIQYAETAEKIGAGEKKARALVRMALAYKELGDEEKAIEFLYRAIRLAPGDGRARVHLGDVLIKSDPEAGLKVLKQVLEIQPNYDPAYFKLASYYYENGKPETALRTLQKGLTQIPNSSLLRSYTGHIYLGENQYVSAENVYKQLTAGYPQKALYWFNLGRAYFGQKRYNDAMTAYNTAMALDKKYYEAMVNAGITSSRMQKYEEAIRYYKKAARTNPKSMIPYYNMGIIYKDLREYKKSLEAFQLAADIDPKNPKIYLNLGLVNRFQKENSKAVEFYKKAIEVDPEYPLAYVNLSYIYQENKQFDLAYTLLTEGRKHSDSNSIYTRIGYNHLLQGEYEKAKQIFLEVIEADPEYMYSLLGLARVYYSTKEYNSGIETIKRCIELNPKEPECRYLYMILLYNVKELDEVKKQKRILARLSPNYKPDSDYGLETLKKIRKL